MISPFIYRENYFGFVYIYYDRVAKRFYIGSHMGAVDDGYICSSKTMRQTYLRRPSSFMRRILFWLPTDDRAILLNEEKKWLEMISDHELNKRYYNRVRNAYGLSPAEIGRLGKQQWEKLKADPEKYAALQEQRRASMKKIWEEKRDIMMKNAGGRGKKRPEPTEERRQQLSENSKAMWERPEHREKLKRSLNTEDYKKRRSEIAIQQFENPEARQKIAEARKRDWNVLNEEQKQIRIDAMVQSNKGRKWFNNGTDNIKVHPSQAPEGWQLGRILPTATREANKGRRWYTNGIENRQFKEIAPEGWWVGKTVNDETKRKLSEVRQGKKYGLKWYNNGQKNLLVKPEDAPVGWVQGRLMPYLDKSNQPPMLTRSVNHLGEN